MNQYLVLLLFLSSKQKCIVKIEHYEAAIQQYRIYLCISRPFMTKKSAQKIALDLYTSRTQRPDQAVREISITTA